MKGKDEPPPRNSITIVHALYGPVGSFALDEYGQHSNRFGRGLDGAVLPRCRDVTNHVQYLLDLSIENGDDQDDPSSSHSSSSHFVIHGKSMNVFFGDPSPNDTKQVVVMWRQEGINGTFSVCVGENEDLNLSFAPVQAISPSLPPPSTPQSPKKITSPNPPAPPPHFQPSSPVNRPTFRSEIHELVIPFLLPYLPLYDKLYTMSLVCKSFLEVIRENGAIERIDANDGGEWAGRGYGNQNKYAFRPDHGGKGLIKQGTVVKEYR
jgi:hypothetical protein